MLFGRCRYGPDSATVVDPSKNLRLSADVESKVLLWRRDTGKAVKTLSGHVESVNTVASSHDNRWLLSAGADTTILVWEPEDVLPISSQ